MLLVQRPHFEQLVYRAEGSSSAGPRAESLVRTTGLRRAASLSTPSLKLRNVDPEEPYEFFNKAGFFPFHFYF